MQPAFELPPVGPPPFVQTTFGEVLAARVAGAAPRGSPFCNAAQVDGRLLLCLLAGWGGGGMCGCGAEFVHPTSVPTGSLCLPHWHLHLTHHLPPHPCSLQACPCLTPRHSRPMAPSTAPRLWRPAPPFLPKPLARARAGGRCLRTPAHPLPRAAWLRQRARRTPTRWPSWPLPPRWTTSEVATKCRSVASPALRAG